MASFLIIGSLENDNESLATVVTIGSLTAILFLGNTALFSWIAAHPWQSLAGMVGYFGVGVCYGVLKWWLLVRDAAERYVEKQTEWLEKRSRDTEISLEERTLYEVTLSTGILEGVVLAKWQRYVKNTYYGYGITKPLVRDNKSRIMGWMMYWPWSGLWTLINDPIRRAFRIAYRNIQGLLQSISDRIYKDIDKELGE
jgi:hypothetical protein